MTARSGPDVLGGEQSAVGEALRVDRERGGRDGDDPGGQAVEPVDEVDGLGHAGDPQHRHQRRDVGREHDEPGERDAEIEHRQAEEVHDRRAEHDAGELGRGRQIPQVVDELDRHDDRGADARRPSGSDESRKTPLKNGSRQAMSIASRKAPNIAMPLALTMGLVVDVAVALARVA